MQTPVAARRPVACKAGLTQRAQQLYQDLAADNSRVLSIDNIVDGFYISPKFLDKVRELGQHSSDFCPLLA